MLIHVADLPAQAQIARRDKGCRPKERSRHPLSRREQSQTSACPNRAGSGQAVPPRLMVRAGQTPTEPSNADSVPVRAVLGLAAAAWCILIPACRAYAGTGTALYQVLLRPRLRGKVEAHRAPKGRGVRRAPRPFLLSPNRATSTSWRRQPVPDAISCNNPRNTTAIVVRRRPASGGLRAQNCRRRVQSTPASAWLARESTVCPGSGLNRNQARLGPAGLGQGQFQHTIAIDRPALVPFDVTGQ